MVTINEIIAKVDDRKPNAVPQEQKAEWLLRLDGKIYTEVLCGGVAPADIGEEEVHRLPPAKYPEDGDMPLLVTAPYDELYCQYLESLIDFAVKDTDSYYNSSIMFDQSFTEWRSHYRRTHKPAESTAFKVM